MKKVLLIIGAISLFSFINTGEKTYNLKFTESEINIIANSISSSENISAKQATVLIQKMQQQIQDSTLNKKQ